MLQGEIKGSQEAALPAESKKLGNKLINWAEIGQHLKEKNV